MKSRTNEPYFIQLHSRRVARPRGVLRSLQVLGIYDRTAIAVLADHGAGLPKEGGHGWVWGAYASPLLLVKPFGARGAFARSTRVVGLVDLPASLCAWTGDCRMEAGSDLARDSGAPPRYPFFVYHWRHEYWLAQSVPIADRYEVRGPPGEMASWNRVGVLP
jgi:arylsulfatase A-like enzyme